MIIDSVNTRKFQLQWIRKKIGLVSQGPILFASTIKENLVYGKDGATLEEIHVAFELSNETKFISRLGQVLIFFIYRS